MKRFLAIAAFSFAMISGNALAEQGLSPGVEPEWVACTQDTDCTIVAVPCGFEAVNITHLEDMKENVSKRLAPGENVMCSAMPPGTPVAVCREGGRCVVEYDDRDALKHEDRD